MNKTNKRNLLCFFPIVIGMVLGVIVIYLWNNYMSGIADVWEKGMLGEIQSLQYESSTYMLYLLKMRGIQVGFIIAMSYIHKKELAAFIWGFITGLGFGFGIYGLFVQYGIGGIWGYIFMVFPHYVCYFWAYMHLFDVDLNSQKIKTFGVVIIGIALECYVNPIFLKFFSKLFF